MKRRVRRNKEYTYNGLDFWVDDKGSAYLISSIEQAMPIIAKDESKKDIGKLKNEIVVGNTEWIKEIQLQEYDAGKDCDIKLNSSNARCESYLPYLSIIDPTPVSWQFIVPAQYVPHLIHNIQEEYKKEFKYVIGKLPMHIGIVLQEYKKPLYMGIKALRRIRRDIKSWEDIERVDAKTLKAMQKEGLQYCNEYEEAEKLQNHYSLYPIVGNSGKYQFYISPDNDKCSLDITNSVSNTARFKIYPNTIDFEFMDANARRNDIYYSAGKRKIEEKNNRPYTWEDWKAFKDFTEYFTDKAKSIKLHQIINVIYTKLNDWKDNQESIRRFMLAAFINILDLRDNDGSSQKKDQFVSILGKSDWSEVENMTLDEFIKSLRCFIDMFEFWHKGLKRM